MRGYPKNLNTKKDYEYVRANFPAEEWKPDWQKLLDTMKDWFFEGNLESKDDGVVDETHKIVESGQGEEKTYAQYVLEVNPTCKLLQLGFTEAEVMAALSEGGGV